MNNIMGDNDNFSIKVEPMLDYVEVRLAGFLDLQTVASFDQQFREAEARLSDDRERHLTLIDVSELKIQAHKCGIGFCANAQRSCNPIGSLGFRGRRLARKMQLRRMLHDNAATFETLGEARDWLFS